MTEVPLRDHLEYRLRALEKAVNKTEGSIRERVAHLEDQVEDLRRARSRYAGQIALATAVVSMAVSAIVAWLVTNGWGG